MLAAGPHRLFWLHEQLSCCSLLHFAFPFPYQYEDTKIHSQPWLLLMGYCKQTGSIQCKMRVWLMQWQTEDKAPLTEFFKNEEQMETSFTWIPWWQRHLNTVIRMLKKNKLYFGNKNSTKIKAEYKQSGNQRVKNHYARCRNPPHCVTEGLNKLFIPYTIHIILLLCFI